MDRAVKPRSKKPLARTSSRRSKETKPTKALSSAENQSRSRIRIEAAIRRIPRGKVSTYGAIARAAGIPHGARLVARILRRGFGLPWQRVLGSGGEIKLRGDSAIEQRLRLESEGVLFRGKKVDMKQCEWKFPRLTKRS
jgi:methylated-DNA-protein-cysteine methyltransferase related protein